MADTQQVTSQTPATKQKNPKRVAAGKAIAEKTRQAREAQKKALAEAQIIIANNQLKHDPPVPDPPAPSPPVPDPPAPDPPVADASITTTQWLSVISIIVSLAGLYYKHEEIKNVFAKKPRLPRAPPRAPPPSPADAAPKRGIRQMD